MIDLNNGRSSAVLLLGNGSPDTLDNVPAYISQMMNGRLPDPRVVDDMTDRFRQIGGQSPLLDIMQSLAAQLEEAVELPVYVAMRYWHPFIKDIILQMLTDGIDHIIAIPLLPHYSILTSGQYQKELTNTIALAADDIILDFVGQWHDCDAFINAMAESIEQQLQKQQRPVIFAARNLPTIILEHDDPYPQQVMNTAQAIVKRLNLPDAQWHFAYHSAGEPANQEWLQPLVEDTLLQMKISDKSTALIVPISTVIDHIDTLYDIDIRLVHFGQQHGIRVNRTPALNDTNVMITILTQLIRQQLIVN